MGITTIFIDDRTRAGLSKPAGSECPTPVEVLKELFLLLEEFGPRWYTEEHHNRALAALRSGRS